MDGRQYSAKSIKFQDLNLLATPYLEHEKRQAFAYLFCPKSYLRPNLLTPNGKLKYTSSLKAKMV